MRYRLLLTLLVVVSALLMSSAALAAEVTPEVAIERLFTEETYHDDWFADILLVQVPPAQIKALADQISAQLGTFQRVEPDGDQYAVVFSGGVLPASIHLDAEGKIDGLFFHPPRITASGLDGFLEQITSLPGQTSLLVFKDGMQLIAHNATQPMAVGSSFKLAVLAALRQDMLLGKRSGHDVVILDEAAKSLPTGILQDWPAGTAVTLDTLATLMISMSDNTATDMLMHLIGREQIEHFTTVSKPFLTTREAFALKNPANADLLAAYRQADEQGRRQILTQEVPTRPLPPASVFSGDPVALDIEWFFSTAELCTLMGFVQDLPLMSVNPGLANPGDWERVAYKGGSEPGVLSLVTWLSAANGSQYCVAATWNDQSPLDEVRLFALYSGLIGTLAQEAK